MTRFARTLIVAVSALLIVAASTFALEAGPERHAAGGTDSAASLYFPPASGAWQSVAPAAAGWDAKALDAALDYAGAQRSSGVVVLYRGRILAERHWELAPDPKDPQDRVNRMTTGRTSEGHAVEDVASAQKSVLSFLAGVARGKGLLDFEAPVSRYLGVGWSKATPEQEAAITVRHLMGMTTGLAEDGSYETPPTGKWMYNTPIYSKLVQIVEKASGLTVAEYTGQWLTSRVAMRDSGWKPREWLADAGPQGERGNTIGFSTTARDLARFGLLVLAGGQWKGVDILGDPTYLAEARTPSQTHNPSYGLLWWLNGHPGALGANGKAAGELVPPAPDDLFAAQGALGRKVYVVPSMELVVTRIGDQPARDFNTELWRLLMAAAPAP